MKRNLTVSAVGLAIATLLFAPTAVAADAPPNSARLMNAWELLTVYGGKSWAWNNGAGYMQDDGRKFVAWSGAGDAATYAEGRWLLTDDGKLCFSADWHSQAGTFPNLTCFVHMIDGGTIYQKRLPAGDWYVFKHAKPNPDDEYNKLDNADLASAQIMEAKAVAGH